MTGVYPAHTGPVTDIRISPHHGQLLVTAGEDLRLSLVSLLQPHTPVLTYQLEEALAQLAWSPTSPAIVAAATANNTVLVFDILHNRSGHNRLSHFLGEK